MPRANRIEAVDAVYHVINRGNYRSYIFEADGAKKAFEAALFEACERFEWDLLAFVLMSNHFHLCVATPLGNLSAGMQWLQATYAARFNRFRKESGHLFQGRFKSLIVEPGEHLLDLVDYIHLNPARAGLRPIESLGSYRWSSLHYFPKIKTRPKALDATWMDYDELLVDTRPGWTRYFRKLRLRSTDDPKEIEKLSRRMSRGWCIGDASFRKALACETLGRNERMHLQREELREFNRDRWKAALQACLRRLGIKDPLSMEYRYSEPWKLAVAAKLKRELAAPNAWLSAELNMGVPNSVSNLCGIYVRIKERECSYAAKLANMKYEH